MWLTLGLHMSHWVKHLKAEPEKICQQTLCFPLLGFVIMQKPFLACLCSFILMFSLVILEVGSLCSRFCFSISLVNDSDSVNKFALHRHERLCMLTLNHSLHVFISLLFSLYLSANRKFRNSVNHKLSLVPVLTAAFHSLSWC